MDIDPELLEKLSNQNPEFQELYSEHVTLKTRVEDLNKLQFLSPEQEVEKKKIQKQKLKGKDRMAQIINEHEKTAH